MQPSVLICECHHGGLIDRARLGTVRAGLEAVGVTFKAVPDLCRLAAAKDPLLKTISVGQQTRIFACYPRAVKTLFQFAGAPLDDAKTQIVNLRETSGTAALSTIGASPIQTPATGQLVAHPRNGEDWIPWFPVIDHTRCTNCQQCLGFCLFGVYGLSAEGKVTVQNPQGCKTNCPACARICPQVAIIFPKYESGSIAGAEITDESIEKDRVQADVQKILGSDVYAALAQRRQKAQEHRLLRSDLLQAHRERQMHLRGPGSVNLPKLEKSSAMLASGVSHPSNPSAA